MHSQPIILLIQAGRATKYKADKDGKEQIIYVTNAGEIMAYHAWRKRINTDSEAVLEDSEIAYIPKEDFLMRGIHQKYPQRLLIIFSHEFYILVNGIAVFAHRSVRERFATQLVLMRKKYKENFASGMAVEINRLGEDLASLVGTRQGKYFTWP